MREKRGRRKYKNASAKFLRREQRKFRIRGRISGTELRPRITIFRSNKHLFAQAIDDVSGKTLACVSSYNKKMREHTKGNVKREHAEHFGELLAEKLRELSVEKVVFDRNGYRYHGIIKTFADGMRKKILL